MIQFVQCAAVLMLGAMTFIAFSTAVGHMKSLLSGNDDRHMLGFLKYGFLAAVAATGVVLNLVSLLVRA